MSNPTVPAAAEGMSAFSPIIKAAADFRRLSRTDSKFSLKVVEMLNAGEDPSALIIDRLGAEAAAPILAKLIRPPATVSDRLNALFARYVAIEAEQLRLADLDTPEGEAQADALGTDALAIMAEVLAIRDRSGNADLIAARILFDLMLGHRWKPEAGIDWMEDAREQSLPLLEILSGQTTGAVRVEVRRALATIGVEIEEEEADPCMTFVTDWTAAVDALSAVTDGEEEAWYDKHLQPFECAAAEGTVPPATTAKGAAAAIRKALSFGDMENQDAALVRAALAFLEGRA